MTTSKDWYATTNMVEPAEVEQGSKVVEDIAEDIESTLAARTVEIEKLTAEVKSLLSINKELSGELVRLRESASMIKPEVRISDSDIAEQARIIADMTINLDPSPLADACGKLRGILNGENTF